MNLWSEILAVEGEVTFVETEGLLEMTVVDLPTGAGGAVSELHTLRNHFSLDGGRPASSYGLIEPLDGGSPDGNTSSI